jgi:hypothetical protein
MPYYINAPTLSAATAVYTDAAMTTCAADGYYAEGPIVRQQVGCVLLPAEECPLCEINCNSASWENPVNKGVYYFNVKLSTTTGPVVINFNPSSQPNGIEVTFDSTVYNTVVSPLFGALSAPAGLPVFIGLDTEDCGIVGTHTLEEYALRTDGMHDLGTTDVVNVLSTQMQLTWSAPGNCTMVIPKPNPTPTNLTVKVISPCEYDDFRINISCPNSSSVYEIPGNSEGGPGELICGYPAGSIPYYVIPVNGDGTELGLYDFMYYDAACTIPLVDNYYLSAACPSPYQWFRIENGIIVEFGDCEATFKYFVQNCLTRDVITVLSPFPLTLDTGTVELSDPSYAGCRFTPKGVSRETPIALVSAYYSTENCNEVCAYYKVYNLDSKTADVDYNDCAGNPQTTTIPTYGFIYLCAQIGSITSGETIDFEPESCECPS